MLLIEKLWVAKLNSIAQSGTITYLNNSQFQVAQAIIPKAETKQELLEKIKVMPWTPIAYINPHNWDEETLRGVLKTNGLLGLAKVILEKKNNLE